jgi:hypothetical protein
MSVFIKDQPNPWAFNVSPRKQYCLKANGELLNMAAYSRIHRYIRKKKGIMSWKCEKCHINSARQLACKDHLYSLNIIDYWDLCHSCHVQWDYDHNFRISSKTVEEILKKQEMK